MNGPVQAINIVFDGPPSPDGGRFVEVETDDGRSISIGQWLQRSDGYWVLRMENVQTAAATGRDAASAGEKPALTDPR
jgi:hypothetical protein